MHKPLTYMGIDPGGRGGVAILNEAMEAYAWRYQKSAIAMARTYKEIISKYGPVHLCLLEHVWSKKGDGHVGAFSFGRNYGQHEMAMAMLEIPQIDVIPRVWQKAILGEATGDTKARSLALARVEYPNVDLRFKVDDGKADALNMAMYAMMEDNK